MIKTRIQLEGDVVDVEKILGIKLPLYQKLYLELMSKNPMVIFRRSSKTGLNFMLLLEKLKQSAETEEERLFFQQMQNEWAEFNVDLNLSYWK